MASITNGTFPGPAGPLEYILNENDLAPAGSPPRLAAVLCHPHPLYGGTMHTKIVYQATQAMAQAGMPVLRFHFRGVGASAGAYDHGRGEQDDLTAAAAFLRGRYAVPLVAAGFSFGSTVVVKWLAAARRPEVSAAVLLGLPISSPLRGGTLPVAWAWQGPTLMISGARDGFGAVADLETYFAALAEPKQRHWIAGADHFLTGHHEEFRATLTAWLSALLP